MIILEMYDGEVKKLTFPTEEKEKKFYEYWKSIMSKSVKININGEDETIKMCDISNCIIGNEAENYEQKYSNNNYNNDKDVVDFFGSMFGFNK